MNGETIIIKAPPSYRFRVKVKKGKIIISPFYKHPWVMTVCKKITNSFLKEYKALNRVCAKRLKIDIKKEKKK